jgi:hypothetical protein
MPTAARTLWRSAGCPLRPGVAAHPGACWWCGLHSDLTGSTALIPDTFPDRHMARARQSDRLCAACAWTLCETVVLPREYGVARVASLATQGRRAQVRVRGADPARYLILRLDSGEVGLWQAQDSAKKEDAWKEAIPALRANPVDVPGVPYLGAVALTDLEPDATEKFRCYHHFGGDALPWEVATDSDKGRIRERLLSPPLGPYVAAIGDGQKHAVIYADPGFGPWDACVYYRPAGKSLHYQPAELAGLLEAIELLCVAGADDDEILTGRYRRGGARMLVALPLAEPVLAAVRGGALLDLALYLRRPRPVLLEDTRLVTIVAPTPPTSAGSTGASSGEPGQCPTEPSPHRCPPVAPTVSSERDPGDGAAVDGARGPASERRQLSLFGF